MATPSKSSPSFQLRVHHGGEFAHAILFRKDGSKPWHDVYATSRGGRAAGTRAAEAALTGYGVKVNTDMTEASYKGRPCALTVELLNVHLAATPRLGNPMVVASKGMATGTKVAIGAAAAGGVAGLIGLGVWLWKRRQAAAATDGGAPVSSTAGRGGGTAPARSDGGGGSNTMSTGTCPPGTRDDGTRCVPQKEDDDFERAWGKAGDLDGLIRTGGYTNPIMGDRGDAASSYWKDFDRTGKAGTDQHGADNGDFGQIASGPDDARAELAEKRRLWNF